MNSWTPIGIISGFPVGNGQRPDEYEKLQRFCFVGGGVMFVDGFSVLFIVSQLF